VRLSEFRSVLVELEAEALTDSGLVQSAAVDSSEDFRRVVRRWVDQTVHSKVMTHDSWAPDFVGPYLDAVVNEQVHEFIVARVQRHRELESSGSAHGHGADTAYRAILGVERSELLEANVDHLRRLHAERDTAAWRAERERGAFALEELDRDAAREAWHLELTQVRATDAARKAMAQADEFERQDDHDAADVQRRQAAESRRELADAIDGQWQLFENYRHPADWMIKNQHWAATVVAADRVIAAEAEITPDSQALEHQRQAEMSGQASRGAGSAMGQA
jgi:hypothetical protein